MIVNLLKRLAGEPSPNPLSEGDARLALAAVMVRVAKADHEYHADEIATIERLLAQRYALSADEASSLRREAEEVEASAPDTVRFTRHIKEAVPYEDRQTVVEELWKVVLADAKRDHEEDAFLRLVINLLGVNDRDSAIARQQAQHKL